MSSHPTPDENSKDKHQEQQLELGEDESLTALRRAWERTLRAMAGTLNRQTIDNWLRPLKPLSLNSSIVVLGAPSSFAREFAEKKYAQTLSLHLAQYLDVPGVRGIWGGEGFACRPCYDGRDFPMCGNNGCMQQITSAMVMRQVEELLQLRGSAGGEAYQVVLPSGIRELQ